MVLNLAQSEFIGVYYGFYYELLNKVLIQIGFDKHKSNLHKQGKRVGSHYNYTYC